MEFRSVPSQSEKRKYNLNLVQIQRFRKSYEGPDWNFVGQPSERLIPLGFTQLMNKQMNNNHIYRFMYIISHRYYSTVVNNETTDMNNPCFNVSVQWIEVWRNNSTDYNQVFPILYRRTNKFKFNIYILYIHICLKDNKTSSGLHSSHQLNIHICLILTDDATNFDK